MDALFSTCFCQIFAEKTCYSFSRFWSMLYNAMLESRCAYSCNKDDFGFGNNGLYFFKTVNKQTSSKPGGRCDDCSSILLFFLYVTTGFSVFNNELSARSSSLGDNADDTRTFIYEEVLDDLTDTKTILLGKGINGRYYSVYFSHNLGDNENRVNPEVGLLSYLLKGGIVYTVIIFLLLFLSVIRTLSTKNNIVAQIFGLLLVQHIFLLFIENIPQYTMYNLVIWCIIGFAFSPELCEIKETEISKLFLTKKLKEQLGEN